MFFSAAAVLVTLLALDLTTFNGERNLGERERLVRDRLLKEQTDVFLPASKFQVYQTQVRTAPWTSG